MINATVNDLNNRIKLICKFNTEELITKDFGDRINIKKYKEIIDAFLNDANTLNGIKLSEIVYDEVTFVDFLSVIREVLSLLVRINDLNSNNSNLENDFLQVSNEIESIFKTYMTRRPKFMELISISTGNRFNVFIDMVQNKKLEIQSNLSGFEKVRIDGLDKIHDTLEEIETASKSAKEQLDKIINDQKTLTEVKLLSKYGDFFHHKAKSFNVQAKKSLCASIWIGAVILIISLVMFFLFDIGKVERFGGTTAFIAAKLAIYAVLFIFLNFTIRSYKTAKHNAVVNENKHLALKTFEIFAGHTQDEKTRDIVLITANNLIYSDINTGYLSHDSNSSYQDNVLEMIKNFNKK